MVILAIIIIIGVFLLVKMNAYQPKNHAVSLDVPIHIDPNTLQPVIPRHVRDELMQARLQAAQTPALIEQIDESEAKFDKQENDEKFFNVEFKEQPKVNAEQKNELLSNEKISTKTQFDDDSQLKLNPEIEVKKVEAFQGESILLIENLADQQRQEELYIPEEPKQVMEFYMYLSDHEDSLIGERFLKILDRYGLRFGEMNYFHRYQEDEQGRLHHMFSLGKRTFEGKTEPFDLNTLPGEYIHAIVFFLTLPHYDAVTGYDMMMTSMHRMARELKGRILDSNRKYFTPELEAELREAIKEYVEQGE